METTGRKSRADFPLAWALIAPIVFGWAAAGRADFEVMVYQDGNVGTAAIYKASTGSPTTGYSMTISNSGVSGGTLISGSSSAFSNFTLSGLNFTSNSSVTTPIPSQAIIGLSSGATISPTTANHTLTIISSDNNFNFPPGGNYLLTGSASYSQFGTTSSDTYKFQNFASPGASLFDTAHTASPGFTFNLGAGSGSHSEAATGFSTVPTYTMTSRMDYSFAEAGGIIDPTVSAIVSATSVPEPASWMMLALGSLGAAGVARRRRSR